MSNCKCCCCKCKESNKKTIPYNIMKFRTGEPLFAMVDGEEQQIEFIVSTDSANEDRALACFYKETTPKRDVSFHAIYRDVNGKSIIDDRQYDLYHKVNL